MSFAGVIWLVFHAASKGKSFLCVFNMPPCRDVCSSGVNGSVACVRCFPRPVDPLGAASGILPMRWLRRTIPIVLASD